MREPAGLADTATGELLSLRFSAVTFDMDGTLVDSEGLATQAIRAVLGARDVASAGFVDDEGELHGKTWARIAEELIGRYPALVNESLADEHRALAAELQVGYQQLFVDAAPIAGGPQALRAACAACPTAIVTSGERESLDAFVDRYRVAGALATTICAGDVRRSKPDPEAYRLASERLGVAAGRCLAFEDSLAGLAAARAAGMRTVAVVARASAAVRERVAELADGGIEDFTHLPAGFFERGVVSA